MYVVQRHSAVHLKAVLNRFQVELWGREWRDQRAARSQRSCTSNGKSTQFCHSLFFVVFWGLNKTANQRLESEEQILQYQTMWQFSEE